MKKSIQKNAILNVLRTVQGMLFPLITYPYITRVLGIYNIGKFNFSNSIIGYFLLIAGFGMSNYAVREVSKVRDDRQKAQLLSSELFTVNLWTTLIAYLLLFAALVVFSSLRNYAGLILIQGCGIFLATVGVDWLNTVYEDFFYVTVRTFALNVLSLVLMFWLVRDEGDLYVYALISLLSILGTNVGNFLYCRRFVKIRLVRHCRWNAHLKPLFLLFTTTITTTIFLNSDQTMLGLFVGDYYVGIYAIAVKIYTILKQVFTSILIVLVPRVANLNGIGDVGRARNVAMNALNGFLLLLVPMAIGLFVMSDYAVLVIGGEAYLPGVPTLKILAAAIFFSGLASFMSYFFVIPEGRDNVLLKASTVSAAVNFGLNLICIPLWQQNGAALTTLISEVIVFLMEFSAVRPAINWNSVIKNFLQALFASGTILLAYVFIQLVALPQLVAAALIIMCSVIFYVLILLTIGNPIARDFSRIFMQKLKRKKHCA